MSTIIWNTHLAASVYRSVAFAAILVLAMFIFFDTALAAEPTLKDVIESTPKEKASKAKPQDEPKKESKDKPKTTQLGPVDELNRGVPRTSVQGFLQAAGKRDFKQAAEYLDLRNLPGWMNKSQGPQLARHL